MSTIQKMRENLERGSVGKKGPSGAAGITHRETTGEGMLLHPKEAINGRRMNDMRSGFHKHLDATSVPFFFTDFPKNMLVLEMHTLFGSFGRIGEVYVPLKCDKQDRRFGFVKFKEVADLDLMEASLEEVWWGECKLKLNRARFGREDRSDERRRKTKVRVYRGGKGSGYRQRWWLVCLIGT
jgi:hypothetical protein